MTTISTDQWTCTLWTSPFLEACRKAVKSSAAFSIFRQDPYIRGVVEARPSDWIDLFLSASFASPHVDKHRSLAAAKVNDTYGSPEIGDWNKEPISGTTAGYILYYAMLSHLFGPLHNCRISEIGGGYGGMASIIVQCGQPAGYTIYDLPDVLDLAKLFLGKTCPGYPFQFRSSNDPVSCDIAISACAYSELTERGMALYTDILNASSKGIISWSVTSESVPWAKDVDETALNLGRLIPNHVIRKASDVPQFMEHFSWWAPNTFIYGLE